MFRTWSWNTVKTVFKLVFKMYKLEIIIVMSHLKGIEILQFLPFTLFFFFFSLFILLLFYPFTFLILNFFVYLKIEIKNYLFMGIATYYISIHFSDFFFFPYHLHYVYRFSPDILRITRSLCPHSLFDSHPWDTIGHIIIIIKH